MQECGLHEFANNIYPEHSPIGQKDEVHHMHPNQS
jgi:hypothetical protein